MTQEHDLRVLGRAAAEQEQPAECPDHDQVQQTDRHELRSCLTRLTRQTAPQLCLFIRVWARSGGSDAKSAPELGQ